MALIFCFLFLFMSSATACDRCVHQSKVAYFSDASPLSSGACGYGSMATTYYGDHLAASIPSIYKNGAGCGACFQIRCKDAKLCSKQWTKVIVTDLNYDNRVDFVISKTAFISMANTGKEQDVLKLGIADVEYMRIPCDYNGENLSIRVEELSQKPDYLAIKFLYQGGQTEISNVFIAPAGSDLVSGPMRRNYGAIWDTNNVKNVPAEGIRFGLDVMSGYDLYEYWTGNVLPADWKVGDIYDMGFQIDAIAQESCEKCDEGNW